jgi:hypothetical protein
MSELRDEIFTDDFPAYRKKEIEVAAEVVSMFIRRGESSEYIKGAMEMFRKILNIPVETAKTKEQKEFIRRRIDEDFAKFEVEYLRRALRDE